MLKTKTSQSEITLIENTKPQNIYKNINQQIKLSQEKNQTFLQKIAPYLYLLTTKKQEKLSLKKILDQTQYAVLPELNDDEQFYKISFNSLKNQCHIYGESEQKAGVIHAIGCEVYFYFSIAKLEGELFKAISDAGLMVRELLTNRTIIVSDGRFNYPLIISKVPSLALWKNESLELAIKKEMDSIREKGKLAEELWQALPKILPHDWQLTDGQMSFSINNQRRNFDYNSLIDDLRFTEHEQKIEEYLRNNCELDSASFPTVSIRSLVHLKARPDCFSQVENGYAVVASLEGAGNQTVIDCGKPSKNFSVWLKRSFRHIPRHKYQARVIFSEDQSTFSLVGEQVASIALFPALLKGVFEALDLEAPKSVRLVAHNEDVLTIAEDFASWVDINSTNKKATTLFRMVSSDGADALSLFEQVVLPEVGLGNFSLQVVPEQFFELIDTAKSLKHSMPAGHDHYLFGLAYQCIHEWGMSVLELQKSLRFDNNDPDILHALGCALMEIGHVADALPFLKKAFDLMPEDPEIANNWGRSSLECGEVLQAISAFERAVRLSPGSADYLKNLGDGYLMASRPQEALDILNKALRCDPYFAEAHASLAHLHLEIGDTLQAEKHALLAYKENPTSSIANLLWRITASKK